VKIKTVYDAVLGILNETNTDAGENYMDRISHLSAMFCCIAAAADRDFRETRGLPSQSAFDPVCLRPDDDFPLDDRFLIPAAYYIASMLLLTDNERRSENLFSLFNDSMSDIKKETPFKKGKTINAYP